MLSMKPDRTFMTARSLALRSLPDGTVAGGRALTPAPADLVAVQCEPLQGDHADGVHDLVARWIVGQHGARLPALEHLAADDAALTAAVQAVAEEIAPDLEVTLVRDFVAHQFGCLGGRVRHRRLSEAPPCRASSS